MEKADWGRHALRHRPDDDLPHQVLAQYSTTPDCTGPSGNLVPGGFGWLTTNAGTCQTSSTIGGDPPLRPGQLGSEQLLDQRLRGGTGSRRCCCRSSTRTAGAGSNATYRIYGYAAFKMTGYSFGGQNNSNPAPCNGNERCIAGYFTRFVDISEAFTYGAGGPQLGASIVRLTQ